jgi:hypothetical protein
MAYRLTIRHGSRFEREAFDELEAALAAAERRAEEIAAQGPLADISAVRSFEAADRVAARIEISRGGPLRGRSAGVDVMGDGALVAFGGGIRREALQPGADESPFDAIRRQLRG